MANKALVDANTQHQLYLTQLGEGEAKKFAPFLREARAYVRAKLSDEYNTVTSATRLNTLNAEIRRELNSIYRQYPDLLEDDYVDISEQELLFQSKTVSSVATAETIIPATNQAVAAAIKTPMAIGQKNSAVYLSDMLKDFSPTEAKRVTDRISMGFFNGETQSEIARAISGTRANGYKDGLLNITRANAATMAKTGVTQMSQQAKETFNNDNDDLIEGYVIVATLDSRTSSICKGWDGTEVLDTDRYQPKPPFHPNCRTSTSPLVKEEFRIPESGERVAVGADGAEEVPATQTYYTWLKSQPASFQDDALGKTKGKIFRNAGLSPQEFKQAASDEFNNPLTIEEMAEKNKSVESYLTDS